MAFLYKRNESVLDLMKNIHDRFLKITASKKVKNLYF